MSNTALAFIPANQYRYYYSTLPHTQKKIYSHLLNEILQFKKTITCVGCDFDAIVTIYNHIRCDVPEVFFVKSITVSYSPLLPKISHVTPEYRFNEEDVRTFLQAMDQRSSGLIAMARVLPELEREKAIHDFLISSVEYKDLEKPYSHEAPSALLYGIAVCDGISRAFKYLCDRLNLQSIVVTGDAGSQGKPEKHAWNLCRIDGLFYHVDATFDLSKNGPRYDYFNLSDSDIKTSHKPDLRLPFCNHSMNYYAKEGLFFNEKQALATYIRSLPKTSDRIVFQLPKFESVPNEFISAIMRVIKDNLRLGFWQTANIDLTYNLDKMVFDAKINRS